MVESKFEKIFALFDIKKTEIAQYFHVYGMQFIKNAKQLKTQGYSGQDISRKVDEFSAVLDDKLSNLLNETEQIVLKLGRKLSCKQYEKLSSAYAETWKDIVDGFKKKVSQEFGLAESTKMMFRTISERSIQKIVRHFEVMRVLADTKIDKIFGWTVASTAIAAISLLLSVISLLVKLR